MALNPPLSFNKEPIRTNGENYILQHKSVEFELIIDKLGQIKSNKGTLVLSTHRIVLINHGSESFKAFDLPLALMYKEIFIQPIFGSNYIEGFV